MDSLITAAGRALAAGDPLGALNRVALRNDAAALALRGIAMAQLGDFARAKVLLRNAARAFGPREAVARARCVVAEAEIALAARELGWPLRALDAARVALEQHGDLANAAHARYLEIRHLLLIGRLAEAEQKLALIDPASLPPALNAVHHLAAGGIALRRMHAQAARNAFRQADRAARQAGIPALVAEIAAAAMTLEVPAARLLERGSERALLLADIETLLASNTLVVDACRRVACVAGAIVPLATRPIPFALVRALAETWPADASRETLIARAFRVKFVDESYRARLRVEIGRLRALLGDLASVQATQRGFALVMPEGREVVVLAPAVDEKHAAVLALLADGEAWSSSALALALATSQRGVQRSLDALASAGKVQSFGRGRARRWSMPPVPGFATTLLLSVPLPGD
jgi:tetratricopeptide (TPR) repeat protein